jgi:uncharacterized transporter YbjL
VTTELVSHDVFRWFLTLITGVVAGAWGIVDLVRLVGLRRADMSDPLIRDKRFGYAMGVVIGVIGVVGALRFQNVL